VLLLSDYDEKNSEGFGAKASGRGSLISPGPAGPGCVIKPLRLHAQERM